MRSVIILSVLAAGVAGCAPTAGADAASAPQRQCFYPDQIDNFRTAEPGVVYLRSRTNQVFKLSAAGACRDVDSSAFGLAIGPEARVGGGRLCTGDWTTLVPNSATRPVEPCRAIVEKALSAEEIAALPERHRP